MPLSKHWVYRRRNEAEDKSVQWDGECVFRSMAKERRCLHPLQVKRHWHSCPWFISYGNKNRTRTYRKTISNGCFRKQKKCLVCILYVGAKTQISVCAFRALAATVAAEVSKKNDRLSLIFFPYRIYVRLFKRCENKKYSASTYRRQVNCLQI